MAGADDLSEGEQSVLTLHPHWKTVLMPIVILIGLAIAAAVLLAVIPHGRLAGPERIAVGALALIIAIAFTLVPLLRWRTTTYELTTRRFRLRYGILSRTGQLAVRDHGQQDGGGDGQADQDHNGHQHGFPVRMERQDALLPFGQVISAGHVHMVA